MLNSQQKGKRFEREIAKRFSDFFDCNVRRTPCSGGLDIKGDLRNLSGALESYVFECKHQENIGIWKCLEQTASEAGHKIGVLIFKRNRSKEYACLELQDWMNLVKELEELRKETPLGGG